MSPSSSSKSGSEKKDEIPLIPDHLSDETSTAIVTLDSADIPASENEEFYEYCMKLIEKHSIRKIEKILEISTKLSKTFDQKSIIDKKFNLKRIKLTQRTSAYSEDSETNSVIIIGEDFQFPDIKDTFDCIILNQGVFSTLLHKKAKNFLNHLFDYLKPNGIIIGEAYHIGGVYEDSCTRQGHRKWLQYRQNNRLVSRLSVSHLDLESGSLQINVRYLFETVEKPERISTSLEAFAIRTYSFPELTSYLRRTNFHRIFYYSPNSFENVKLRTFKFAFVAEKS